MTACAAAELLNAYPALIVCPPHLVRKWAKEIERAVPGAMARIVNCLEKGNGKIGTHENENHFERVGFPSAMQATPEADADASIDGSDEDVNTARYSLMDFVRDWRAGTLGTKAFAILSRERAKLGSGWAPVAGVRKVYVCDEGVWLEVLCDPDTGEVLLDDAGAQLLNDEVSWRFLAARQRFSQTEPVKGWELTEGEAGTPRRTGKWGLRHVRTPLFTQGQGTGTLGNLPTTSSAGQPNQSEQQTDVALRVGFRRYPLAAFIHRKLRGFFKLFIADEAHQFKAARSDQAIAFHQISRACRWTLGLTGSLFGGKSTSLFHLAHRTSHDVREDFGVDDERRWAERFGVLETTQWDAQSKRDDTAGEDGAWSGYARERVQVRELPGISPGIVRYLLPHVVFARIADLGYELPPYEERVARLDMSPAQAAQVWGEVYDPRSSTGWLYKRMLDALKSGDNSLLSVWLQTALARPNSAFRIDAVTQALKQPAITDKCNVIDLNIPANRRKLLRKGAERATLMQLTPVTVPSEWLPKERWLMDYCASETLRGRRVLVYVRQTGTRDIQGRLVEVLRSAGLRPKVLRPSIAPERREAWVQNHAAEAQVLITNPKLVETGLDLVAYHSVVFYETEWSLYTMWQAMRRVWRLGQTQPVAVTFLSYRDTLEDLALRLMGRKLYAAQLLYGDEVGGAIVESDDGNFLAELARAAISQTPVDDYAALFTHRTETESATAEMAQPDAPQMPIVRIPETTRGVSMFDLRAFVGRQLRRQPVPAAVPETQISLFN